MKNEFATLLHDLIKESGVKNLSVSNAVGYDLSYISKWLSGKMLPSDKSIDSITSDIADCVTENIDDQNILFQQYNAPDKDYLKSAIARQLGMAYKRSKGIITVEKEKAPEFYPEMPFVDALVYLDGLDDEKSDIAILADLFALNREDRLAFLGIQNGNFIRTEYNPGINLTMIVDVDDCSDNVIYDALSIIHMVSGFSLYNFNLYNSREARQKFCFSILADTALTGTVFNNERNISFVAVTENVNSIAKVYSKIKSLTKQDSLAFTKQTMQSFVDTQEYIKSMLSTNVKWLMGHMTELLLPDGLFNELLSQTNCSNREEMLKIHKFSGQLICQNKARIIIYETAISDMLATGVLDFFNNRIELTIGQELACIDYLLHIVEDNEYIKMIETGFSLDFQHVYSPCMYVSDASTYVRLEDAYNRENVQLCINRKIKNLFNRFFDEAWSGYDEVVISDKALMKEKLTHYKKIAEMMASE